MQLLTTFVGFFRSRQKILIKRRKIALKNRPISSKRLKQQQQTMNISYETKLVQIKKQLDRKKSQNHHLNEIIEELFYPDMQMQNEQQVELRAKQLANSSAILGENWEEDLKSDELTQSIKENYLPVDLLALHEQRWEEFTPRHYEKLMHRMAYYCSNREKIKKKMMEAWEKLIKKMQEKEGKNKPIKCPYLFLETEQITRHEHWATMMQQIHRKMSQTKDIGDFNQYLSTVFALQRTFSIIPAEIYYLIFTKNALANFQELTPRIISKLNRLLRYRNIVKYDPLIKISPEGEQQAGISHFARKLATQIINHPQSYSKEDFINIFNVVSSNKKRYNILTQQLLSKSETIVSSILNELSFSNVLTYTIVYALFTLKPNIQLLQILKFDLYRKCDSQRSHIPLLLLMSYIRSRKLTFRSYPTVGSSEPPITFQGYDLVVKAADAISKMINKMNSNQILAVLNACFNNDLQQHPAIEIISTEFVKHAKDYDLETLAKGFLKITLLGHRSKILSKYVFEQYVKTYHDQVKKYKEEENLLLPTEGDAKPAPLINYKVIHLQECLVLAIWGVTNQLRASLKSSVSLDELLTLIPVHLESSDPLVNKLAESINGQLKPYSLFPKIQAKPISETNLPSKLKEFYMHFKQQSEENTESLSANTDSKTDKFYDLLL